MDFCTQSQVLHGLEFKIIQVTRYRFRGYDRSSNMCTLYLPIQPSPFMCIYLLVSHLNNKAVHKHEDGRMERY